MTTFAEVEAAHRKWLYLDHDPDLLRLIVAAVIANRYDGKPVWLMIAGPSGSGKTAILTGIGGAAETEYTSAFTSAAFASGAVGASPMLEELNGRIGLVKDFSTINSMPAEPRNNILSILRDVYDGEYRKWTGKSTMPIEWAGKIGLFACSTPKPLERTVVDAQQLGERFLIVRVRITKEAANRIAEAAYAGSDSIVMRDELEDITGDFLDNFQEPKVIPSDEIGSVIRRAGMMIARSRSGISRDRQDRTVDYPTMDTIEIPGRLVQQLKLIAMGLMALESTEEQIRRIIYRIGSDCIPAPRLRILQGIIEGVTVQVALARYAGMSLPAARRIFEELLLLGVIEIDRRRGITIRDPILADMLNGAKS